MTDKEIIMALTDGCMRSWREIQYVTGLDSYVCKQLEQAINEVYTR